MTSISSTFTGMDIALLRLIHHHRIEALDGVLYWCSFAVTYVSIVALILIFVQSMRLGTRELRMKFYMLLTVFLSTALVSFILKSLIFRERPFVTYPDIIKLSEAGSSSFPSGHTMEVFALAFAIAVLFPKRKFIIPAYLWAIYIAYTRMALGVHYPFDVLSGMLIGTIVSFLILKIFKSRN